MRTNTQAIKTLYREKFGTGPGTKLAMKLFKNRMRAVARVERRERLTKHIATFLRRLVGLPAVER